MEFFDVTPWTYGTLNGNVLCLSFRTYIGIIAKLIGIKA